jgi:dolichyl-phosphate beta-glucosyltransferase
MRLSVIIPAYNEEIRLSATLRKIDAYLQKQNYLYELLAIDDGSTDKTRKVAKNLTSRIKNLKVIECQENKGKGYAVRLGMLRARGEYCLFVDADNSTSIEQIEKFWPELEGGADIVIASRDLKGSILNPPQSWWRRMVLGEVYKRARKVLLNLGNIEDTQCGFKCFKKEAAKKVFSCCQINGFAFDVEVLLLARKMGFSIKEVPVYWRNSSSSKVTAKSIIRIALDLLKIKKNSISYFKRRH